MTIRQRVARFLLREAGIPVTGQIDSDEYMYRPLTKRTDTITLAAFDRHIEISRYLYDVNLFAKRLINITKDFVVGEGFKVHSDDEQVQKVLDMHWNDPFNRWDIRLGDYVRWLGIKGEWIISLAKQPQNGLVRIGYIDPTAVKDVKYENGIPAQLVMKPDAKTFEEKIIELVKIDLDKKSETFGQLAGDAFWFPINQVDAEARGRSDLFASADWLDGSDQFIFTVMERANLLHAFVWDVMLNKATDEEIQKFIKNTPTPKPGSMRVHNESVTWSALAPQLNSADINELFRIIKNYVLGGHGFPEHWFAEGGETNRATAVEMATPTLKMLTERQLYVRYIIEQVLNYQIETAVRAGYIKGIVPEKLTFEIDVPDINIRDIQKLSASLLQLVQGLVLAMQNSLIRDTDAVRVLNLVVGQLGVTIEDVEEIVTDNQLAEALRAYETRASKKVA